MTANTCEEEIMRTWKTGRSPHCLSQAALYQGQVCNAGQTTQSLESEVNTKLI